MDDESQIDEVPNANEALPMGRLGLDPLPRWEGLANVCRAAARLTDAIDAGDGELERSLSIDLARKFAARGTDLDEALRLALRALELAEDPGLRSELSGWLAGVGESSLAANELEQVAASQKSKRQRSKTWMRAAVLRARAGEAEAARANLAKAAASDETDPIPLELAGTLASWASIPPELSANAYLEAAARREAMGDSEASFEDTLRAFESARTSPVAANHLADSLAARSRHEAADEVLFSHAEALEGGEALIVHLQRLDTALDRNDLPCALSAIFDARLEMSCRSIVDHGAREHRESQINEVFERAGMYELIAARLETRVFAEPSPSQAASLEALARLYEGPLGRRDLAEATSLRLAALSPSSPGTFNALVQTSLTAANQELLVEAYVRALLGSRTGGRPAQQLAIELTKLADGELRDLGLAKWAMTIADRFEDDAHEAPLSRSARIEAGARQREEEIAKAEAALARLPADRDEEKRVLLHKLVGLYRSNPDASQRRLELLTALVHLEPSSDEARWALTFVFERRFFVARDGAAAVSNQALLDEERTLYVAALRARLQTELDRTDENETRLALARALALDGRDSEAAVDVLKPLLRARSTGAATLAEIAALCDRSPATLAEYARALMRIAEPHGSELAGSVLAAASGHFLTAGDLTMAARAAEAAIESGPSSGRASRALALVASRQKDKDSASAIERATSVLVPSIERSRDLAHALDIAKEPILAFAWTQRWLALAPASPDAIRELCRRAIDLGDGQRLNDALLWVLAQPEPLELLTQPLIDGLHALFVLDPTKAKPLSRKTLDVLGPRDPVLRRELVALADEHGDPGLAIAALERWIAVGEDAPVATLLELVVRRSEAGDLEGAARELARAASLGGSPDAIVESVSDVERGAKQLGRTLSGDARIWLAEARARSFREFDGETPSERTMAAFRELGALRWDLADDYRGSEQALFAGSEGSDQFDLYVADVTELAGVEKALSAIEARAAVVTHPGQKGRILGAGARAAIDHGLRERALDLAEQALASDASLIETIGIAEAAAKGSAGAGVLSRIYVGLAGAAMGSYGQRAAHYRAARQLEKRGELALALVHAIAAFEAVPSEGTSYHLLMRLVEQTDERNEALRAFERVAGRLPVAERGHWLKRACDLAPLTIDGQGNKLGLLLRMLHLQPESTTVAEIEACAKALIALGDDRDNWSFRLERAIRDTLGKLEGPDGAFVAIRLARACIALDLRELTFESALSAVHNDAGHGSFKDMIVDAAALAQAGEPATKLLDAISASRTAGMELLRLGAAIAKELGAPAREQEFEMSIAKVEARDLESRRSESFDLGDPNEVMFDLGGEGSPKAIEIAAPASPSSSVPSPAAPASGPPVDPFAPRESVKSQRSSVVPVSGSRPVAPVVILRDAPPSIEAVLRSAGENLSDAAPSVPPPAKEESATARSIRLAKEAGDHARVAELLQGELDSATDPEALQSLRLALADVFENDLSQPDEAVSLLLEMARAGASEEKLFSRLSTLIAAQPRSEWTGPTWDELALLPNCPRSFRKEFSTRAVEEYLLANDGEKALACLRRLNDSLPADRFAELNVSALRLTKDRLELARALEALADAKTFAQESERAELLLEAAGFSLELGDESTALLRVRRAARIEPTSAKIGLELARLEYRTRGSGTPREAQETVDGLNAIEKSLPPNLVELHTFLLGEALDVLHGGGAGMRELTHRHAEVGPLPLIALGMAERLARGRSYAAALPLFRSALEGDMQGMRSPGRVALAAADAAIQVGDLRLAAELLEQADQSPDTRGQIERKRRELDAASDDPEIARVALDELIASTTGLARARFLERLAQITEKSDRVEAIALYEKALAAARHDKNLSHRLRTALIHLARDGQADTEDEITTAGGRRARVALVADGDSNPPPDLSASTSVPPESATILRREEKSDPPPSSLTSRPALPPPLPIPSLPVPKLISPLPPAPAPRLISPLPVPPAPAPSSVPPPVSASPPPPAPLPASDSVPPGAARVSASPPPLSAQPPSLSGPPPLPTPSIGPRSNPPLSSTSFDRTSFSSTFDGTDSGPVSRAPASRAVPFWPTVENANEEGLFNDLLGGTFEAGEELAKLFQRAGRTRDVLVVRRRQVELRPGNTRALDQLFDAANADHSSSCARAVEHVLTLGETRPPVLVPRNLDKDLLHRLLFRDLSNPSLEALSLIWDAGMMRKDLAAYRLTNAPRVVPGAGNPLSEALSQVLPLFATRTVYQLGDTGEARFSVALLSNPAIVFEGDPRRQTKHELSYLLAGWIAASLPQFAIVSAESELTVRTLLDAVIAAYAPVREGDPPSSTSGTTRANIARLGAELWRSATPRIERRFRELAETGTLDFGEAKNAALMAKRRAGFFACGDIGQTIRFTLAELGAPEDSLTDADSLEPLCAAHPEVADIVRLATRMEFTETRF